MNREENETGVSTKRQQGKRRQPLLAHPRSWWQLQTGGPSSELEHRLASSPFCTPV